MTAKPADLRDRSLDAFRGLTVLLMILVNLQPSGDLAWQQLVHAPWHGLTLADLVFPWFLFIVGLSVPLALDGRAVAGVAIGRRALLLFLLGLALAWLIRPTFDPEQIRWMGVLQRIGIVYLACAFTARSLRGWRGPALLALLAMAVHAVLLQLPPPDGAASLAKGAGLAGWLDRALLPGRLYPPGWDPEGVLSTLGATASGLAGVATMRWWRDSARAMSSVRLLAPAILLLGAGGVAAWATGQPVNKPLWTPAFVLMTAGLGLLVWVVIRALAATAPANPLLRFLAFAGRMALTVYVIHMLLIAALVRKLGDGTRLWDAGYGAFAVIGLSPPNAALALAVAGTLFSLAVTAQLARRGWAIRL